METKTEGIWERALPAMLGTMAGESGRVHGESDSQQAEQISRPQPRAEVLKMTLGSAKNLHERKEEGVVVF